VPGNHENLQEQATPWMTSTEVIAAERRTATKASRLSRQSLRGYFVTLNDASYFAVDSALSAVSDPSGAFLAKTATWAPAAKFLVVIFNSVTGVFGGTVTF
jgi:hypothetical protein